MSLFVATYWFPLVIFWPCQVSQWKGGDVSEGGSNKTIFFFISSKLHMLHKAPNALSDLTLHILFSLSRQYSTLHSPPCSWASNCQFSFSRPSPQPGMPFSPFKNCFILQSWTQMPTASCNNKRNHVPRTSYTLYYWICSNVVLLSHLNRVCIWSWDLSANWELLHKTSLQSGPMVGPSCLFAP